MGRKNNNCIVVISLESYLRNCNLKINSFTWRRSKWKLSNNKPGMMLSGIIGLFDGEVVLALAYKVYQALINEESLPERETLDE